MNIVKMKPLSSIFEKSISATYNVCFFNVSLFLLSIHSWNYNMILDTVKDISSQKKLT